MPGSTPIYGFPYPDPSDLVANYPALGQDLAEDIEAVLPTLGGATLISPSAVSNSGGTASNSAGTVTFSGVSSVSVDGLFSATYQNYLVLINVVGSTTLTVNYRMRTVSDDTSSNYFHQEFTSSSTTNTGARTSSATSGRLAGNVGTDQAAIAVRLFSPNVAATTNMTVNVDPQAGFSLAAISGAVRTSTQYTGISLIPSTGNITGKIRIYGFKGA